MHLPEIDTSVHQSTTYSHYPTASSTDHSDRCKQSVSASSSSAIGANLKIKNQHLEFIDCIVVTAYQ